MLVSTKYWLPKKAPPSAPCWLPDSKKSCVDASPTIQPASALWPDWSTDSTFTGRHPVPAMNCMSAEQRSVTHGGYAFVAVSVSDFCGDDSGVGRVMPSKPGRYKFV